ncbi:DEAD-box type RNA helicase [Sporothrix stenoceras]|uniref:DEAD-box type RNA helicase n=1 Tax=Sporothrix stenoceras TaxID=5173 RepID=A0ABR3Z1Q3_9PEZI
MKSPEEVYEEIIASHQELERIPPDVHLFCPRMSDEDQDDYDDPTAGGAALTPEEKAARQARLDEGRRRLQLTSWASLILGINRDQADRWLDDWIRRTESFLVKCDGCVRAWHMERKALKDRLLKEFDEETANIMEGRLHTYDTDRITRGLKRAVELLETHGPMSSAKLVALDAPAVLAFYEALCCVEFLSLPDNRKLFNYVFQKTQEKKPLKIASAVIPTMTVFLFQADPLRSRFARMAWERRPPQSLTTEQFDWAVSDYLADAIDAVNRPEAADADIERSWSGFLPLLDAMSPDLVLHSLRGMQIPTDIYNLAIKHINERSSDQVLAHVLRAVCALMDKSSKAFWDALSLMNPPQLPMFVCGSQAFAPFLARSFEPSMQLVPETSGAAASTRGRVPLLVAFVQSLMRSLNRNQRPDVCDYFLNVFLTNNAPHAVSATREGHSTCIAAGLNALQMTLGGYLDSRYRLTAESVLFVNTVINSTVKHHDYVVRSANLHPGDRYNIGLSQAAVGVIESALALDTRAIQDEWTALQQNARVPSGGNERRSNELWDVFRVALAPKRLDLARVILSATLPLRGIQRFAPKKRQLVVEDASRRRFNDELDPAAEAIASTVARVSETLTRDELQQLLSATDAQNRAMDAVASTLVHAEDAIREAGVQLISTLVDEDSRSEAIGKMVYDYPVPFLTSFANSVSYLTGGDDELRRLQQQLQPSAQAIPLVTTSPFEPMRHIFRCSKDILTGLCDTSTGLLRSRSLTPEEQKAVKRWWTMEWQFVDHSFLRARAWSEDVEKSAMENYCRDVMEFAERLMAQDGLIASALGGASSNDNSGRGSPINVGATSTTTIATSASNKDKCMREVLDAPRKYSMGLFEMIQLRDPYLVRIIVQILVKLFTRLKEYSMTFPDKFVESIRNTYRPHTEYKNKFRVNTNMNDTQRAELMRAIGDGADEDDDDVVEIVSSGPARSSSATADVTKKKQTSLEAWSRAGAEMTTSTSSATSRSASPAVPPSSLTSKDAASQLTPGLNKHRAMLEKLKAAAAAKPDQKALLANRAAIQEKRRRDKAEMDKHKAEAIAKARALRGGPPAPLKSDIMVDSDEEEEDDDDDDDDGAAALIQQSKKGEQMLDDAERRRRMALKEMNARLPVKKIKVQRSAKDMRARIIPSMDRLHRSILEWDIFYEGNDPPNMGQCAAVANDYNNPDSYKGTFFPLLINEAWRSFVTSKDESTSKPFGIKVMTRMAVDNFLEVSTVMTLPPNNNENANANGNGDRVVGEGDIVLLSKAQNPLTGRAEPHCLARVSKTAYKRNAVEVTYRVNRNNLIAEQIARDLELRAIKITNMTTIEREFAALESLQYYDLMDEVLKATPSPMLTFGDGAIVDMARNYDLNRGQALAILHGKANDGFTLVQGPPGTGKTKTIVAMVGALLTGTIKANAGAVAMNRPGNAGANNDSTAKKLLVCAPSNAAVDELVLRLKAGIKETTGVTRKINVLRLGRSDVINAGVRDVTLDELVKAEIARQTSSTITTIGKDGKPVEGGNVSEREKIHQRAGEIKAKLAELSPALEAARASDNPDRSVFNQLQREIDQLRSEQRRIGAQIERDKESGNTYAREAEIKKRQIQQKILNEAHVLCATLSGSGHEIFKNLNVEFETVIIDEAAQCVELSALIPLKYGCAKCILVGDPKQLPPTVLSQSAARYGYDQSLFVRMQRNRPKDVHLLDTQYRMHPEISLFPSQQFYESRLIDGGDMAKLRRSPWHVDNGNTSLLGPYRFFDVEGVQARGARGQSLVNENEIHVAMQLYKRFMGTFRSGNKEFTGKVGIITPYKAQLFALRSRFSEYYGPGVLDTVEFNTTDAFQGRECDVIIFSCVRASPTGGIGFMTDIRRMNVGLTRAKSSLWILGDSRALRQGEFWRALIEDAKERKRYTGGDVLSLLKSGSLQTSSGRAIEAPKGPKIKTDSPVPPIKPSPASTAPSSRSSSVSNGGRGNNGGGGTGNANMVPPTGPKAERDRASMTPAKPSRDADSDDDNDGYSPPAASSPIESRAPPSSSHALSITSVHRKKPAPALLPTTYTVADRPSRPIPPSDIGMGGINERGEPLPYGASTSSRPVIMTSSPSDGAPKKRPHEGSSPSDGQPMKKAPKPPHPPRRPTDPSAMEVLGIDNKKGNGSGPGAGPSSGPSSGPGGGPSRGPSQLPPRPVPRPPKKRPADSMFIKKKPKRP